MFKPNERALEKTVSLTRPQSPSLSYSGVFSNFVSVIK